MKRFINSILFALIFLVAHSCGPNILDHGDEGKQHQSATFPIPATNEAIDLGLTVNWAPYNIGATNPYEYGNYYSWGETEPKEIYNSETYSGPKNSNGNIISSEYDVAHVKWGNGWRMPSFREIRELYENCILRNMVKNGVKGIEFTSKINGNSIFLPAAGGCDGIKFEACGVNGFYLKGNNYNITEIDIPYFNLRSYYVGQSVRAVIDNDYDYGFYIKQIEYLPNKFCYEKKSHLPMPEGNFHFKITLSKIPKADGNIIVNYGYIIFRDGEVYKKVQRPENLEIETYFTTDYNYLTITEANGTLTASSKEHWSIAAFITQFDHNNESKTILSEIIPLDFKYSAKPSIELLNFKINNYGLGYFINDTSYTSSAEVEFTAKVTGSFFRYQFDIDIDEADIDHNEVGMDSFYSNDVHMHNKVWQGDGNYHFKSNIFNYLVDLNTPEDKLLREIKFRFIHRGYSPNGDKKYDNGSSLYVLHFYKNREEYHIK